MIPFVLITLSTTNAIYTMASLCRISNIRWCNQEHLVFSKRFERRTRSFSLTQLLVMTSLIAHSISAVIADNAPRDTIEKNSAVAWRPWTERQRRRTSLLVNAAFNKDFQSEDSKKESRRKQRWTFGKQYSSNKDCPHYWKEMGDGKEIHNFHKDMDIGVKTESRKKERIGFCHFGRIDHSGVSNENTERGTQDQCDTRGDEDDQPLRTNLWDINVNWSLFSPKSKRLSRSGAGQRGRSLQMELHPEGYCRIIEDASTDSDRCNKKDNNFLVVGIGRWKKRPWGVTFLVRPLMLPKSSINTAQSDDDRGYDNVDTAEESKNLLVVDEDTEFIFHARGFHWNGFGSSPKLTQGTILFQKQTKKDRCFSWWKSSSLAYSSVLPVWPEEVALEKAGDCNIATKTKSTYANLMKPSFFLNIMRGGKSSDVYINIRRRWFRPVVGTFTAKGIVEK